MLTLTLIAFGAALGGLGLMVLGLSGLVASLDLRLKAMGDLVIALKDAQSAHHEVLMTLTEREVAKCDHARGTLAAYERAADFYLAGKES